MGLYNHNINNLNGGVSQQPDAERFDSQVESMDNFQVTVAQGLRKRNPLMYITDSSVPHHEEMAVHSYNRGDGIRKYSMTLCEHGLQIYGQTSDFEADISKTVIGGGASDPVIASWISAGTTNWKRDIEFLTAGDTTWILNKNITVKASKVIPLTNVSYYTYIHVNSVVLAYGPNTEVDGYLNGYIRVNFQYNGTTYTRNSQTWAEYGGLGETKDVTSEARQLVEDVVSYSVSGATWDGAGISYANSVSQPVTVSFTFVGSSGAIDSQSTTVGSEATISNEEGKHAFYWLYKSFDEGSATTQGFTYSVTLNDGTGAVTFTANKDSTLSAASDLSTAINANALYSAKRVGSILRISHANQLTFSIETGDSYGNQASRSWKSSLPKIADLPADMNGFSEEEVGTIAITGTDTDNFTNYYLKWADDKWKETVAFGQEEALTNTTLPAKLVQVDDDTFELSWIDWESRYKGDSDSAPSPSFVGSTLSNVFFFKNRLGFTSEDNVILSESGEYYNFYPTTVMEILDSDPIDAGVDSDTVSIIRNVNATAGALTVWADNAQFLLSGGEILSPATTRIAQTSSYTAYNTLKPMVVDNEIIFFNKLGSWLDVLSYNPASLQADKSSAESIAAHVPNYLPSTIDSACTSPAHNLVFLFGGSQPNTIYAYKYYIIGGERKISAWFKWVFDFSAFYDEEAEGTLDISAIDVLDNELFVFAAYDRIFRMTLEPQPITSQFVDFGNFEEFGTEYTSRVVMSRYNVMTAQKTMTTREPFYIKNVKVNKSGKVDFSILNSERSREIVVNNKHLGRKLVVGGNSDKVNIGFVSSYDTGCEINTVSLEGRLQSRSRNI